MAQANGTTAGTLLELPATPRQLAFQGAYAAIVGDAGTIFVNPAGMAPIHRTSVGVSYERQLMGTTLSTAAVAFRAGRFDFGFGAMYLDLGGDSVVVPDPAFGGDRGLATGEIISAYHALGVGAVAYRRGMMSVGASGKFLQESYGGGAPSTSGVTGDVGAAIALFDIMAFGFTVQNVAGRLSSAGRALPLPRTSRLGITLNIVDPEGTSRLLMTTDWVSPPGSDSYWAFGFEGGAISRGFGLLGRAGVSAGRAPSDRKPWSLGAELVVRNIRVEYAYQGFRSLGSAHRVGLRWER